MTVAKVTASSSNEQMTKLREFCFASQRYEAFNLRKHKIILFSRGISVVSGKFWPLHQ